MYTSSVSDMMNYKFELMYIIINIAIKKMLILCELCQFADVKIKSQIVVFALTYTAYTEYINALSCYCGVLN